MWRKNLILGSYSPTERPEKAQQENIELVSWNLQGSGLGQGCSVTGILLKPRPHPIGPAHIIVCAHHLPRSSRNHQKWQAAHQQVAESDGLPLGF